jgi:hypothetical protein
VLACHGGQHGIAGPQGSSRYIIVNSMLQEPAATRTTVTAPTLAPLAVTVANDKSRDHYRQIDFCWDYYLNFSSTTLQILHSPILPFSHSPILPFSTSHQPRRTPVPPLSISAHSSPWPTRQLSEKGFGLAGDVVRTHQL